MQTTSKYHCGQLNHHISQCLSLPIKWNTSQLPATSQSAAANHKQAVVALWQGRGQLPPPTPIIACRKMFLLENFLPKIQNLRPKSPILEEFRGKIELLTHSWAAIISSVGKLQPPAPSFLTHDAAGKQTDTNNEASGSSQTGKAPSHWGLHKPQHDHHQALLKAKYCPRVAAALCTHKNRKKTHVTLTHDLEIKWGLAVVKVHAPAKYHLAEFSGSWVIVLTSYFALFRNGEKSENPVLWPWHLILKFSGFMSYCAHREKKSDENNSLSLPCRQ